jgi:DNA polymerase-3 subunit delta
MLYVFHGPDSFSRHEALAQLRSLLDEDGALATNTVVLDGRRTTPEEVMAACSTVPFLGAHRLVVVEGLLESMAGRGRKGRKKAAPAAEELGRWGALVEYLPSMPPTTTLVLLDGGLRSEPALLEALAGKGEVRRFPALAAKELPGWLQRRAREKGLRIETRAANLVAELMGGQRRARADDEYNDLWALANELDKLAAAAPEGLITEALVRELSPLLREQKGYFLWDALIEGRPNQATRLLHDLQGQGDNPQGTLGLIAAGYRRLAVARGLLDEGESTAAIARALNLKSQFPAEKLAEQASRYPLERLREAFRRVVAADFEQKTGLCEEELTLELLVQDLSTPPPRPTQAA